MIARAAWWAGLALYRLGDGLEWLGLRINRLGERLMLWSERREGRR